MEGISNNYVEIKVLQESRILTVEFFDYVPTKDFISILEYQLKLIKHYSLNKVFVDLRAVPVYGTGAPEYVKDSWFPAASSIGVRYMSFAMPKEALGKMSMKRAHEEVGEATNIKVEHFLDPNDALKWLKTCDTTV